MGRMTKFFRRIWRFFRHGNKKTIYENSKDTPSIEENISNQFKGDSSVLKDHQNPHSTLKINEEVKEILEFLITNTDNAAQVPHLTVSCHIFEQNASGDINSNSTKSNSGAEGGIQHQDAKIAPEIVETLEFLIEQVELGIQNEPNSSHPVDNHQNGTMHVLVEDQDMDPEIIGIMDDLITGVQLEVESTIQSEPNYIEKVKSLINHDNGKEMEGSLKKFPPAKPPRGLKKISDELNTLTVETVADNHRGAEIRGSLKKFPPAKPPRGLKKISAELNTLQTVETSANDCRGAEIQGLLKKFPPAKPPRGMKKMSAELNTLPTVETLADNHGDPEIQGCCLPAKSPRSPEKVKEKCPSTSPARPPHPETKEKTWPKALTPLKVNYCYKGQLGMGGFGQVYFLRHKITEDEVAAKVVVRSSQVTNAEQDIWPNLDHPNILGLIEQHQYGKHNIFVSPKQETSLIDIKVPFTQVKQYLLDALRGLEYLHTLGLCHLDVKLDNILIGKHGAMLCDFGFMAQSKGLKNSSFAPPHVYRPPEASISKGPEAKIPDGKAVDLWEFGVMMLRLFTRFHSQVYGEDWKKTFHPALRNALKKKNFKNRIMFSYYEQVDKKPRELPSI
ncbi:hypothetical protein JTE90_011406 [Oedothorax gibbosus]|uniref:Protein kinase domain-containing protein n=1 Tax=Oedothorax gibbosus TaxID=931172 RepID=A0AAV6U4I2_9ARAC|nr:hypothetical protein JTE90_011406 [Oedothorax gibbosus]